MTSHEPLLDPAAAAAFLNISKSQVYRLVQQRRLGFVKVGQRLKFTKQDLDRFIEKNRTAGIL